MIDIYTSFWLLFIIFCSHVVVMHKIPVDTLTIDTLLNEDVQKKLGDFFINLSYNGIYYYSVLEIKCKNIYGYVMPYIEDIKQMVSRDNSTEIKTHVELVCKDGRIINKVIVSKVLDDITKDDINEHLHDKVEMMVIKDKNNTNNSSSSKICVSSKNDDNIIINNDISNIRFIDLSLIHNGSTHKIDLKNDEHNFYVVNNKIDETFLKYYLTNILQINLHPNFEYKLQLLDHEVNISFLDNNHSIIIEKDGYKIENKIEEIVCDNGKKGVTETHNTTQDDMERISEEFEKIDKLNL